MVFGQSYKFGISWISGWMIMQTEVLKGLFLKLYYCLTLFPPWPSSPYMCRNQKLKRNQENELPSPSSGHLVTSFEESSLISYLPLYHPPLSFSLLLRFSLFSFIPSFLPQTNPPSSATSGLVPLMPTLCFSAWLNQDTYSLPGRFFLLHSRSHISVWRERLGRRVQTVWRSHTARRRCRNGSPTLCIPQSLSFKYGS